MVAMFTPPQGTRGTRGVGSADEWGPPVQGRATIPQASRSQRQLEGSRQSSHGRDSQQRGSRGGQRKAVEGDARMYRDIYQEAEHGQRRAIEDLEFQRKEETSLAAEVQRLRIELDKEKHETKQAVQHFKERIEHEKRDGTRMQMAMMKVGLGGTAKDEEASDVKDDVVNKANEILEAMREMREQQQQAFKQVKSLSYAMLKACSQPTPGATGSSAAGPGSSAGSDIGRGLVYVSTGTRSPNRSPPRSPPSSVAGNVQYLSPPRGPSPPGSNVGSRQRSASDIGGRPRSMSALRTVQESNISESEVGRRLRSEVSDIGHRLRSQAASDIGRRQSPSSSDIGMRQGPSSEDGQTRWFKQMQANLEQFGDVEVFSDDKEQECMCCNQMIASNYRVRPRKCNHCFHIECLLHWWTEGTCPVCHVSFAPEADEAAPEARPTERSSSASAARRDGTLRQTHHGRRRSPGSTVSAELRRSASQPRNIPSDGGFRTSPSIEDASNAHRSTSQQSNAPL